MHKLSENIIINPQLRVLAQQMSNEHGLTDKGISYSFGSPKYYEKLKEDFISDTKNKEQKAINEIENSDKSKIIKKIKIGLTKLKNKINISKVTKIYTQLIHGTNAFYFPKSKKALLPLLSDKQEAVFHEFGHAITSTKTKNAGKIISFLRHKFQPKAIFAVLLLSAFSKNAEDADKKRGTVRKIIDIVKNNIMAISLAIYSPMLIDEGLASYRAVKFLKGKVTAKQLNAIKSKSFTSWGSYGLKVISTALVLKFAVWVSDKIKIAKQASKNKN